MSAKKKTSTKPPSGMRDFLPGDVARREHVIAVVREVYGRYGFVPLETPSIESLETLLGKYGEEGDQLLYRLLHRRDALARALARDEVTEADLADKGLRYDLTVPLARVVAQYDLPRFFKRYQIQPVWRADRPGKGRFREFYQCDVDIVGTEAPIADAEVCAAPAEVLARLGFDDFTIRVNHRELLRAVIRESAIDPALEGGALVAVDKLDKIGAGGVLQELVERGVAEASAHKLLSLACAEQLLEPGSPIYEVLDSKLAMNLGMQGVAALYEHPDGGSKALLAFYRRILKDERGLAVLDELGALLELLADTPAGPRAQFAPHLARGLSYYTGAIFEFAVPDYAGSIGGGGRYDNLIGIFGKDKVPAVGFALGLERVLMLMEERGMFPPLTVGPEVLLCWRSVAPRDVLACAHALRAQGLRVEVYPEPTKKLGKQVQYADASGAGFAAILGEDELAAGAITLKHLASGTQERAAIDEAAALVRRMATAKAGG